MKDRLFSLLLAFSLTLTFAPPAQAADSGKCGDHLRWTLNGVGTLTISGKGPMWNWRALCGTALAVDETVGKDETALEDETTASIEPPWEEIHNRIKTVVIKHGVTSIGKKTFKRLLMPAGKWQGQNSSI